MAEHSHRIRLSGVAAQVAATYAAVSVKTSFQHAASEAPALPAGVFTDRRGLLLRTRLAALVRPPLAPLAGSILNPYAGPHLLQRQERIIAGPVALCGAARFAISGKSQEASSDDSEQFAQKTHKAALAVSSATVVVF
jgi:hypothetical protein